MNRRILILIAILMLALVGCRQTAETVEESSELNVTLDTGETPTVGESELQVTVTESDGTAIDDATVAVRGDMTHAGMVPVDAIVTGGSDGVYTIPFEWTMGGDWILTVTVTTPDDRAAVTEFEVSGVEGNGADIDIDDENDMGMNMGAVSAAYMQFVNDGDSDITLISAQADNVGLIEVHETTVENDIARMQEIEGGLVIPAGEAVLLRPGGKHLMLMDIDGDLVEGETLQITLEFDNDSSVSFSAPIAGMEPLNESGSVSSGDITVNDPWVRPTVMADMDVTGDAMSDMGDEAEVTETPDN